MRNVNPMIIVSSLASALEAVARYNPAKVISLLSEDEEVPDFGLPPEAHLKLYVESDASAKTVSVAARNRAEQIVAFLADRSPDDGLLVHCNRGVSRSTAAAYIAMCIEKPDQDERKLAERLRRNAPHADPCILLVSYADDLLHRDGRMVDAIGELCPPCAGAPKSAAVLSAPQGG